MLNNQLVELIKYIFLTYLLGFTFYSIFFKKILKDNNLFINIALSWGLGAGSLIFILYILAFNQKLDLINISNLNYLVLGLILVNIINIVFSAKNIFSNINFLNWISLLIFIFLLKPLIIDSLISYLIGFDAVAMWFLKAKSFMLFSGVWNNTFFTQSGFEYANKAYPIGFPLMLSGFFRIIKFANDQIIQLYLLMFFINIIFIFYGIVRKILNNLSIISQLLITISLFFIPIFMIYAHNGYADMAVSFIFTACIGIFILSQKSNSVFAYQLLALIISSSGILIKNEAIPFFIIFNLVFLLTTSRRFNIKKIIMYIIILIFLSMPIVLWEIFKRKYHLAFYLDNATITTPIMKIKTILFHFMDEFIRTSYYSLSSIIVLITILIQTSYLMIKRKFSKLIPLLIITLMFLSYGYVYLITTVPLQMQLESSFERLFLHLLPSMYLVTIYQFKNIFEDLGE